MNTTQTLLDPKECERRRDVEVARLQMIRGRHVRKFCRAFIQRLLIDGNSTTDPVRLDVPTDPNIKPQYVGAAVAGLVSAGIIKQIGYERSARPEAHARVVRRWELVDHAAAVVWLRDNPAPMPDEPDLFSFAANAGGRGSDPAAS